MKNERNWAIADGILGLIGAVVGLATIFTGFKSRNYNENRQYEEIEKRYGLTPIEQTEVKEDE